MERKMKWEKMLQYEDKIVLGYFWAQFGDTGFKPECPGLDVH